jgi:hypothetical protein
MFEVLAAAKMAFLNFAIARSFSPERLMRNFGPIVQPGTRLRAPGNSDDFHRRPVGPKAVRHDHFRVIVSFHRFARKRQCSPAIPPFDDE